MGTGYGARGGYGVGMGWVWGVGMGGMGVGCDWGGVWAPGQASVPIMK